MGILKSGDSKAEQLEEQRANQEHMQNIAEGLPEDGVDPDFVERVTNSELDQGTVDILSNMLSRDWVLSNLDDAEVHEIRWLARVMMDELEALHPSEESIWTGEIRKYASDDDRQALRPLDDAQKLVIFEFIQGTIARAARSKDGWQQEIFKKQIKQSERVDRNGGEDGGWL